MATLRLLFKRPGYALACICVLALGIGANSAIFSLIYSVVLNPLPYPDVDRLVFVWEKLPSMPEPIGPRLPVRRTNYIEWQRQNTVFSEMAAVLHEDLREGGTDRPRLILTGFASANLFAMLGADARLGRLFRPDEEQPGQDHAGSGSRNTCPI
jgi:putative ABC transport system permease protein